MKEVNDYFLKLLAAKGYTERTTIVVFNKDSGPKLGPNRKEGMNLVVEEGGIFKPSSREFTCRAPGTS